jgi:hypothetical protein
MNLALLIAVEQYADPRFARRVLAAADARGVAEALRGAGFAELDQVLLVDGQATKTIVESKLRRTIRSLAAEDTLLLYVAAHGCADRGRDYLVCHDTQAADLVATSVSWQTITEQLRGAECERVICFVDSCSNGLNLDGEFETVTQSDLRDHFTDNPRQVCFASCSPGETSWPALNLKQGAWASQLITALEGQAPRALVDKELLTARSLQKHWQESLPRVLQKAYGEKKTQTPLVYGPGEQEFLVADLSAVIAERAGKPNAGDVLRVTLLREQIESIRSLAGFKKNDKVPTAVNSYAKSLVADLGSEPIAADVNEVREALRKHFAFKRKDLDAATPGDGTGSILTPYFVYSITVTLNPANPAEIIWRRQVSDIKEPEQVLSPAFENVFPKTFSTVEFLPPKPIDLPAFIDELEDAEDDRVKLNYDPAATWCRLSMPGLLGQIEVTPERLALIQLNPTSPQLLLETFFKIQAMLVGEMKVKGIGFGEPRNKN